MPPLSAPEDVARLWLATLQRALGRASHDLRDALNGVSVNLEVIRGRAANPGTPAAAVAPFAEASAQQLERLTSLLEAVLALGRAERQPADVSAILRRVVAVCGASSSSTDAEVQVELGDVDSAATSVHGDAVRLALTAPLLELATGSDRRARPSPVRCVLRARDGAMVVSIAAAGRRASMPDAVGAALRAAGVRWSEGGAGTLEPGTIDLSLVFPRA